MKGNQLFRDAQAKAEVAFVAAGAVGLVESVKNIGLDLVGYPASMVGHLHGEMPAGEGRAGADTDGAAGGGVGQGVVQEDPEEKEVEKLTVLFSDIQRIMKNVPDRSGED